jgi:hypothetical protein
MKIGCLYGDLFSKKSQNPVFCPFLPHFAATVSKTMHLLKSFESISYSQRDAGLKETDLETLHAAA